LLDLKPCDIGCHTFRFVGAGRNFHPTALKTDEKPHYREDVISLKMAMIVFKVAGIALTMNYGLHLSSALAYGKLCVPESVWGIASSLVATASPVCSLLLSTMTMTQNNYAVIVTTTIAAALAGVIKKP
jgi:hypothetical protein